MAMKVTLRPVVVRIPRLTQITYSLADHPYAGGGILSGIDTLEINPIKNKIADLRARTDVLRGYL